MKLYNIIIEIYLISLVVLTEDGNDEKTTTSNNYKYL